MIYFTAEPFWCYLCDSNTDPRCLDPFNEHDNDKNRCYPVKEDQSCMVNNSDPNFKF